MTLDPALSAVFSDLFVDLAAGWFGTVFVAPVITEFKGIGDIVFILHKLSLGCLSLLFAIKFRELQ